MNGKTRIGLWTSAWDSVAWELNKAVILSVKNKGHGVSIPNSQVSFVLFSQDQKSKFGSTLMSNVRNEGITLLHFLSNDFLPDYRKAAKRLFKDVGDESLLWEWRIAHDQAIVEKFGSHQLETDFDFLLGYMGIVGPEMCSARKMINLHPALPWGPKGTFWDVIRKNIETKEKESGVMIHLVTKKLDLGPVISFCRFPISGGSYDLLWQLWESTGEKPNEVIHGFTDDQCEANGLCVLTRNDGVVRETPLILWTLKALVEGSVIVENGKVFDSSGKELNEGYDLTDQINAVISG